MEEIHDPEAASVFGLGEEMLVVMLHCGSRGLGHQTCTDQLQVMGPAMDRYGIALPDRQLVCVPADAPEGRGYLGAMAVSANFAWANRHVLAHEAREAFADAFGISSRATGMHLVFDVAPIWPRSSLMLLQDNLGSCACIGRGLPAPSRRDTPTYPMT